jgi:hypothetical protein
MKKSRNASINLFRVIAFPKFIQTICNISIELYFQYLNKFKKNLEYEFKYH